MHDTALSVGSLVMRTYCPPKHARILDVGAQDMNGSLRDVAPRGAEYVGLDYEAGKGVDIVLEPGKPWPVEDDHFDLVLATSVLEHDNAFWMTFEAMCRKARPGGHIYISAPSNGIVHRCPKDYWRFYPDAGLALKAWVAQLNLDVTLVESFIAEREKDMWNDFCAVFRREPSSQPLNRNYLYLQVPCTNAIVWESEDVLNPRTESEDMMLILREREEVRMLHDGIASREQQMAGEAAAWAVGAAKAVAHELDLQRHIRGQDGEIERLQRLMAERDQQVRELEQGLAQLQDDVETARAGMAQARDLQRDLQIAAQEAAVEQQDRIERLERELCESQQEALKLNEQLASAEEKTVSFAEEIARLARSNRNAAIEVLRLQKAAFRLHQSEKKLRWLRKVHARLSAKPWWTSFVPPITVRWWEQRSLKRSNLFDGREYLQKRPDVRAAGIDPLRHYILHGMDEAAGF